MIEIVTDPEWFVWVLVCLAMVGAVVAFCLATAILWSVASALRVGNARLREAVADGPDKHPDH